MHPKLLSRAGATVAILAVAVAAVVTAQPRADNDSDGWVSLFDGRTLDGWTPKIAKHVVGENYGNTFRVEDGVIKVAYDQYATFDQQFGHLYTNSAYSHYVLRLEYKLTGRPMVDAPSWAGFNSGVMLHAQSPLSLTLAQSFPVSLEGQFLAVGTSAGRQTGNACTPGTDIEVRGQLTRDHVIEATGKLYPVDEWVTFEAEVHGHDLIIYRVNGVEVLRYEHPQLDARDTDAQRLLTAGVSPRLSFGHIALQAEGHPVWYRNIRLRPLER